MKHNAIKEYNELVFKLALTKSEEKCLDKIREIGVDKAYQILEEERRKNV